MQLKDIQFKKHKKQKRIARGGKRGTTSGRGTKGQKSRTGHRIRPAERDFIKKIPKLRGYQFKSIQKEPIVLNVGDLEKYFKDGGDVNLKTLAEKKLIKKSQGGFPIVKLLGSGDISIKLLVSDCQISKSAKEKIEKAGGQVK